MPPILVGKKPWRERQKGPGGMERDHKKEEQRWVGYQVIQRSNPSAKKEMRLSNLV